MARPFVPQEQPDPILLTIESLLRRLLEQILELIDLIRWSQYFGTNLQDTIRILNSDEILSTSLHDPEFNRLEAEDYNRQFRIRQEIERLQREQQRQQQQQQQEQLQLELQQLHQQLEREQRQQEHRRQQRQQQQRQQIYEQRQQQQQQRQQRQQEQQLWEQRQQQLRQQRQQQRQHLPDLVQSAEIADRRPRPVQQNGRPRPVQNGRLQPVTLQIQVCPLAYKKRELKIISMTKNPSANNDDGDNAQQINGAVAQDQSAIHNNDDEPQADVQDQSKLQKFMSMITPSRIFDTSVYGITTATATATTATTALAVMIGWRFVR